MNNNYSLNSPVLFLIYNRPKLTQLVFNEIRKAKPKKLFVAADGPNVLKELDSKRCQETRDILKQVDWDCKVETIFRENNLGCEESVSNAISWFFENVDEGIILEDDCVAHQSFFRFCDELLVRYRLENKVMTISGSNFQFKRRKFDYSYYFSRYFNTWGWASWKRVWNLYDINMKAWPNLRDSNGLKEILGDEKVIKFWNEKFEKSYNGTRRSWEFPMTLTCFILSGFTIVPNVNLISNIGFGLDSTHTDYASSYLANLAVQEIKFPLKHPTIIVRDVEADDITQKFRFFETFTQRLKRIIVRKLNKLLSWLKPI